MATPREIHRHIKSVKNIQQITKAMKMVAAARLRRAQEKAASSRPFSEKVKELLISALSDKTTISNLNPVDHPLLQERPIKRSAYIVVSSDKGLAGAYNTNLLKHAMVELMDQENYVLITVGRKAKDFFSRRGFDIEESFFGFSDKPTYEDADDIAYLAKKLFTTGVVDEVILIYTQFKSALSFTPLSKKLLPVIPPTTDKKASEEERFEGEQVALDGEGFSDVIFEPAASETLKYLVPYYVKTITYASLMQSAASELGARMTAMSSATDNANDLLKSLELSYNKARQAGITSEINEIVGGAEALQ
ncbi:MAG TPA: ATP synthase F1 subunit gamma [Candidatus Avacidaminococcus intestinavium]|uniref:ATP synthase gamma chain n=1 Tax=Candidatus Avacidaminococcus intestinavium TaxID=2840684 RepID=A0A9D1MQ73_9FIRM|nr:ATP synthase F1 subunit gamma [Candidatus Avacidaminococcus intestinavium]